MVPTKLMDKIAKELDLTKDELIKESLEGELRRRLSAYKITNFLLTQKYKMSFDDFEKKNVVAKNNFSFEVEEDYETWDQSSDGVAMLEKLLKGLEK